MHPFTAFLAAEHLQDLLREADDERRAALVRSVRPHATARTFAIGRRAGATLRRLVGRRTSSTSPQRSRPAGA